MMDQSLKRRYFAKLFTNLIGLTIGLVTQAIIPRGLGPKAYGDFNFLTNFFSQLMPFFTLSTSIGFYTKISQRQNEFGIVSFYFQFIGLAMSALFLFIGISKLTGFAKVFWLDQGMHYVYLAAVYCALATLSGQLTQMADAYGITVSTELAKIIQKCFGLLIICMLFFTHQLSLNNYFLYQYSILIFLSLVIIWIMARCGRSLKQDWRLSRRQIKEYVLEFYVYSHPLFVYSLVGMLVGILDLWMLQKYSGSVQQGFFGLSCQIGAVCFLFTSAMTSLITREFSIAYSHNDLKEMARLYRRYIPMLYSIAAFLGCFACVQAENFTLIFGGGQFAGAALPVAIMALYPIHQTYGQLSGSVFYASGQTGLYRNIGLFFMIFGLPVAYIMIAPPEKMGIDAGATGLAIKFVVLQFIGVNVYLFYNARFLNLRFSRYLAHQIVCLVSLLFLAFLSSIVVEGFGLQRSILISFFMSGVLYSGTVGVMVYFVPVIFGLQRKDITNLMATGIKMIFYKKKQ